MAPVTKVVWNEGHGCSGNGRVEQSVKLGDELEKREILKKKKKLDRWVGLWRWPDGSVGLNLMPLFPTLIQKLQFKKRSHISAFARHSSHLGKNGLPKSIRWR